MRALKFRGKRIDNGKWTYGPWIYELSGHLFIRECDALEGINVDPHTIGQFTGLLDSKGREIYEGDIVKVKSLIETEYSEIGSILEDEVAFSAGRFYIKGFASVIDWDKMEVEIIGNIHESE